MFSHQQSDCGSMQTVRSPEVEQRLNPAEFCQSPIMCMFLELHVHICILGGRQMGSVCDVLCRWYTACSVQVESGCSQPTDSIEAIWKGLLTRKVSVPLQLQATFLLF